MPTFPEWLDRLLADGAAVMDGPPECPAAAADAARTVLRRAYAAHALGVAGPPLPFDADIALSAAEQVAQACWRLVAGGPGRARPLGEPTTPAAHLSADLTLRLLPAVHRRARLRAEDDPLATELAGLLRRWPLSGVLADLTEPPAGGLDFGGHAGLQLLYAERLVGHEKPGWLPAAGPARERVELVYRERGRPLPVALQPEEVV
jgi:hypothetical protein